MSNNNCAFIIKIFMKDESDLIWYENHIKNLCASRTTRLWRYIDDYSPTVYYPHYFTTRDSKGCYINFSGEVEECFTEKDAICFMEEFERCAIHLSGLEKVTMFFHNSCRYILGQYTYEKGHLHLTEVASDDVIADDVIADDVEDPNHYSNLIKNKGVTKEIAKFNTGVFCKRCGARVWKSSVEGYEYTCYVCDEDLYNFETVTKEN